MSKRPTKKYKNKTKQTDKQTNKQTKQKSKLRLIKKQRMNQIILFKLNTFYVLKILANDNNLLKPVPYNLQQIV